MIRGIHCAVLYFISNTLVACQDWQKISTQRDVMYEISTIDVNKMNVSVELLETSLLQCSYKCQRRSSLSFYFVEKEGRCYCSNETESNIDRSEPSNPEVVYGVFRSEEVFKYQNFKKWLIFPEGHDCYHYYLSGYVTDGIYFIKPKESVGFHVWCDMSNGGWTVFQNRYDGSVNFNLGWTDYRDGFGVLMGEFWLGLNSLHYLTKVPCEVVIEMTAPHGNSPKNAYLKLANVTIGRPETNFTLSYENDTTNCTINPPVNYYIKDKRFSTPDVDNDYVAGPVHCAEKYQSGWWFSHCYEINLNGVYGSTEPYQGLVFKPCWGDHMSLQKSRMKLLNLYVRQTCDHPSMKPSFITSCYSLCKC